VKTVRRLLTPNKLPEPFKTYWKSKTRLNRKYSFYDVDGELYIDDSKEFKSVGGLLHHWTLDGCRGINCYRQSIGVRECREFPYVSVSGTSEFECYYSAYYTTSIRDPKTGQSWVVQYG
jgi:hypothetical protein